MQCAGGTRLLHPAIALNGDNRHELSQRNHLRKIVSMNSFSARSTVSTSSSSDGMHPSRDSDGSARSAWSRVPCSWYSSGAAAPDNDDSSARLPGHLERRSIEDGLNRASFISGSSDQ